MQPFNHLSYQWQVIDKISTPKNPYEKPTEKDYYTRKSEGVSWGDFLHKQYTDFEQFSAAHKMETDAPDGVYEGSKFQMRWQYNNTGVADGYWSYATNPNNFTSFENYTDNCYYPTRQFLEYIGEAKGEEKVKHEHTPAPWFPVKFAGWWHIHNEPYYEAVDILDDDKCDKAKYNATLAAASPELLKACELAILELQLLPCKCDSKVIDALEAAIKSATTLKD